MERRWPGRFPVHGCSSWRQPGTGSSEPTGSPSPARSSGRPQAPASGRLGCPSRGGSPMSVHAIEHRIADDQVVWAFGPKMTPVLEVDPGTVVTLSMKDGLNGQITREDQLVRDILTDLDLAHVNGATGPIAVVGAEPGDSLVVDILDIRTAPTGVSLVIPGVGQLHLAGLEARTKLFQVDGDTIHMNERISFPIRPMLGVMGVATGSEDVLNGFAGE